MVAQLFLGGIVRLLIKEISVKMGIFGIFPEKLGIGDIVVSPRLEVYLIVGDLGNHAAV